MSSRGGWKTEEKNEKGKEKEKDKFYWMILYARQLLTKVLLAQSDKNV